jgi:hypothetical protein
MKQSDIDMIAEARIRRVKRFSMWMWLFLFPALGVVLYLNFSSGEQPAVHRQPPAFSCASQRAEDALPELASEQPGLQCRVLVRARLLAGVRAARKDTRLP